eukprot:6201220-Pleurochrysis_carterae.AAC.4
MARSSYLIMHSAKHVCATSMFALSAAPINVFSRQTLLHNSVKLCQIRHVRFDASGDRQGANAVSYRSSCRA